MDDAQYESYLQHDNFYEDAGTDDSFVMEEPHPASPDARFVEAPPPPQEAPQRETPRVSPRETAPVRPDQALPPDMHSPTINLRLESTPPEFMHLYASLERQTMGVGDVTLMSGETLGTDRPYVLGITSAVAGEGKTTTALHLAMTIARDTFKKVCLLDLSLGRGDLGLRLGVPSNGIGVVSVLEDADGVVPTLQLAGCDNMVFIPAGKKPVNAARLARSPRVAQLLVSARYQFDVVIVDLPAVSSDNALPLTRHMDGLLVVARSGVTPRDVVSQAVDILGRDKVVGVALNRTKPAGPAWLHRRFNQG